MNFLKKISSAIGQLNEWVGKTTAWLTSLLVIVICTDVTLRYIFNNTKAWIIELEWHLFALIFLLAAGYALKHDKHVRVDVFYANFSERNKAWINLLGSVLFLIPWCMLIVYVSYGYAHEAWIRNEGSPNPGGLPARYIIKSGITVGVFLLMLQGIAVVADSLVILNEKEEINEV